MRSILASSQSPAPRIRILVGLLLATLIAAPTATYATSLAVTRFDDPAPNGCRPGDCSLREAILAANSAAGPDTIALSAGTYALSLAGASEDAGTSGDLDIAGDTTLTGAGANATAIDANQLDRALDIISGSVTIAGITVAHGAASSGTNGGGIRNSGKLTIAASTILSNTAGVLLDFNGGSGGGIYSTGTLRLIDSTVSGNTSDAGGGGIYSTGLLTVTGSTFTGNMAGEASGGALLNAGQATIRSSAITKNKTWGAGGGIGNSGSLELFDTQITDNSAHEGQSAGGGIVNAGTLTVTASLISHNDITSTYGGGLYNSGRATLTGSAIEHNIAFDGPGGVYNERGVLALFSSTVEANTSQYGPTGLDNYADLILHDSTLSANSIGNSHVITATNSTLSSAPLDNAGRIVFRNATITHATLAIKNSGIVELTNTILAGNDADCQGALVSHGHNLVGNATGCAYASAAGDLVGTSAQPIDPRLGPLHDNGGATPTYAPLPGSPALDAGNNATCAPADQRGVPRPQGAACDIGAVEWFKGIFLPLVRAVG